ncbi:hypothetical protein PILCRDRAFT_816521 [Piloderma croceum F 1598]|uniref:Uncharacterized protein n=1 Tax=Piloderma croceum (strain F 1598) TaxID=765440 RepID=A0A0C3G276_PILCF|nr:hypothetical protein PILCRDRAFT_816521 [Piloderma croceum F 1598]
MAIEERTYNHFGASCSGRSLAFAHSVDVYVICARHEFVQDATNKSTGGVVSWTTTTKTKTRSKVRDLYSYFVEFDLPNRSSV